MEPFNLGGLTLGNNDSNIDKQTCAECGNLGDLHCAICDAAHYCSYACQTKAWTKHKAECKGGQAFPIPPPPTAENMGVARAIYFASGEIGLTWIRYIRHPNEGYISVDLRGALAIPADDPESGECEAPMWFDITHSTISKKEALPYTLRIHGRDDLSRNNYRTDHSGYESEDDEMVEDEETVPDINLAIQKLKQTGDYAHAWSGPVIVYGIKELTGDSHPKELVNIGGPGTDDLLHLMNFFNAIRGPGEMVPCVRVNCEGDVRDHDRPEFESVMLPTNHAIFGQASAQISDQIELPVVAARIPGNIDLCGNTSNSKVTYLYRGCDPGLDYGVSTGYGWGSAPLTWDIPVGSCIVARKDKKPLLVEHAQALTEYCCGHLGDIFNVHLANFFETDDDDEALLNKDEILDQVSMAKFEEFFQAWKVGQGSIVSQDLASPYT